MTFRPLDILLDYAASPEADVRANAAAALGEMTDPQAQQKVVEMLGDTNRRVREAAFRSHLSHPAAAGLLPSVKAARRLRAHSADLVGRRVVGPSVAGIAFAVVFALLAYLLLTGLVSRTLESAVWDSIIYAAITAAIGAAFAVVAATASRPISFYRGLAAGLIVELGWTLVIGILPALAMGALVSNSILPATETGIALDAAEDQVKSANFIWHFAFLSGGILVSMLAARLAGALAARSLPPGSIRAIVSGLCAFMFAWFALWLLLLPWQAGARTGEFDVGLVGRIGLGAFVGLGAYAATIGFVESVGARLSAQSSKRWFMRAGAMVLALPGVLSIGQLAMSLPASQQVLTVDELSKVARINAPQMVQFILPIDAQVMLEVSPSSLKEEDRVETARGRYGRPFADRAAINRILEGSDSISRYRDALYETDKGYDFWINEYYAEPDFSAEARQILEYWAKNAPRSLPAIASSDDMSYLEPPPPAPAPVDPADPAYAPGDPAIAAAAPPSKTWASKPEKPLTAVPAWLTVDAVHTTTWTSQTRLARAEDGSYQGVLPPGGLEVCVTDDDIDSHCNTNQDFDSLFTALGERAIQSWPLLGRPRTQAEVRLTVLTDVDQEDYRLAANAAKALREAARTSSDAQDTMLIALTTISQGANCDTQVDLLPGDIVLRRRAAKPPSGGQSNSARPADAASSETTSTWLVKQGGYRSYDDPSCAATATGQVIEVPALDEAENERRISEALQLGAVFGATLDDKAQRERLARFVAEGIAAARKEASAKGDYRFAMISSRQLKDSGTTTADVTPANALTCEQEEVVFLVGGPAAHSNKGVLDRINILTSEPFGDAEFYLGPVWKTAWSEMMSASVGDSWALAGDASKCGQISLPPEALFGPLPSDFNLTSARRVLEGDQDSLVSAFDVYSARPGFDYWVKRYEELGDGRPLDADARARIEHWIRLGEIERADRMKRLGAPPEFGTDAGGYARDGTCDDPRFEGGMSLDDHRLSDATDCREAWEAGNVTFIGD